MLLRRVVRGVGLVCLSAWLAISAVASEYHGQVIFGGQPLPGSTVTVTATQGDKKAVAISDGQGVFAFPDLADGKWTLTIQMTGFAPLKQEVTVAPAAQAETFELKLLSLDEIRAEDKPLKIDTTQLASAPAPAVSEPSTASPESTGGAAAGKPAVGGAAMAKQPSGGILINGSQSNAATSQFSMNQAFGNSRNRRSLYNGGLLLRVDNSALDAAQYSLTGTPVPKAQFNNYTLGLDFGGPLNIKHLMPRGPNFTLSYTHTHNNTYNTDAALLPTGLQASGDWQLHASQIFVPSDLATVASACDSYLHSQGISETQIQSGNATFANNIIPSKCVSPASIVLLGPYQKLTPNVTGNTAYNYQVPLNSSSAGDTFGLRMSKGIGKNYFFGNTNFSNTSSITPSIFGFVDNGATLGMNAEVNWSRNFNQRLHNVVTYTFSRQRTQLIPAFANKNNIEGTAGIAGPANAAPDYWGPPNLGFSSSILGLSDRVLAYNRNEANGIKDEVTWSRMRHFFTAGVVFNRKEFNYHTETNPDGNLYFSGAATRGGSSAQLKDGSDLADFLLGIPDTSAVAYGNADKYLRQSTYRVYLQDEVRIPEVTIKAGVRWEHESPVSEAKGNLVNVDVGQNFSSPTPVVGSNPLLHTDYGRPEPVVGIGWRPFSASSLVIDAGYEIDTDTSVYQQAAYAMAQQYPLSISANLSNSPIDCPLSLANPFPTNCGTTPDSFAIDPNFRVGYVQTWNLVVKRDLPFSMQMVATYLGTKGTHGVQEFLPNTCPSVGATTQTACNGNKGGYTYRTSNGNLEREAGTIQLRRRPRNGFSAGVAYTFAKSLDDDYSLSGQGSVSTNAGIAQDWRNPRGQRGLSNTDQRHLVVADAQYTTGMGIGGKALLSGWRGVIYKDWSIRADFSAGSGLPETPIYAGANVVGTGISGFIRPDVVGSPRANPAPGHFLNPAAYAIPANGYGNARRNSIEGPNTFSLNATMSRSFRLHGHYTLEAQIAAINVLNHVVITGWNTSWIPPVPPDPKSSTPPINTFGAPTAANAMRNVSVQLRVRY